MKPQASEDFYKLFFDNAKDGILVADLETKNLYLANNAICKMLGYSIEEFKNLEVTDIHPKEDLPYVMEQFEKQARGEIGEYILAKDMPVKRKDGSVFYADINASPIKLAGKVYLAGIFRDITERKQMEKDLKDAKTAAQNVLEDLSIEKSAAEMANARDEAMLSSIGDGLIAVDKDGKIILTNSAFEKLLGWSGKEVQGKMFFDVLTVVDENGKPLLKEERPITKTLLGKTTTTTTTTTTTWYKRKDGSVFPAAIIVSPIMLKDTIVGVVEVFRDITREKEIDKAKTEFVSLASHQLRTPLTAINWYIEMLQGSDAGALNDKQKNFLFEIYKGSRRMIGLINDLLNVSRLETGRIKIEPIPTDLSAFIRDMLKEFEPLAKEKDCHISFELPKVEVGKINVDQILLRQVIANLLTNAIQYSSAGKAGQVKISLVVSKEGYIIYVTDNGIGIPKEVQGHIFEKLFRADNAHEIIPDGTGLGLYLAKQIMESSGGSIGFSSEPGQETMFYVTIPISGMISKQGEKGLEK